MITIQQIRDTVECIPSSELGSIHHVGDDKKHLMSWFGMEVMSPENWNNIWEYDYAKDFNTLFVSYLYPVLRSKGVYYNELMLKHGVIPIWIGEGAEKLCKPLGINHKDIKGRILQAIDKIEKIMEAEFLLGQAMDSAIDTDCEIIE